MKRTKPITPHVKSLTYDEALADFMTQLAHECDRVGPLAGVFKDEQEFVSMMNMKIDKLEHQFMRRSFMPDVDEEESYKRKTPKKKMRTQEDELLRSTALEIAAYGFAMYLHNREKASKYTV